MRSPLAWFGGKGSMIGKLLPLIPHHDSYVEVFGGAASLLFAKAPMPLEIYNDIDSGLIDFFSVLKSDELLQEFQRLAHFTPYSRELFEQYRQTWATQDDLVTRAYQWFVVCRMSFSGNFGSSWSYSRSVQGRVLVQTVSRWLGAINGLSEVYGRLMTVQIEHADWSDIIKRYDKPDAFLYFDPPYIHSTRSAGKYAHEMSDEDHRDLVESLLNLRGKAMVSGYNHEIYQPLVDNGWIRHEWKTSAMAAGRTRATGIIGDGTATKKQPRIECVWVNYQNQLTLFN